MPSEIEKCGVSFCTYRAKRAGLCLIHFAQKERGDQQREQSEQRKAVSRQARVLAAELSRHFGVSFGTVGALITINQGDAAVLLKAEPYSRG